MTAFHHLKIIIITAALFVASSNVAFAVNKEEQEKKLEEVKQQISQTSQLIKSRKDAKKTLEKDLKTTEKDIAENARAVRSNQIAQRDAQTKIAELSKKLTALQQKKKAQQEVLAQQLVSAYTTGTHDYSKLLLNQQNSGKFERVLGYYKYLNEARVKAIQSLKETVTDLEATKLQVDTEQQQLAKTLIDLNENRARLQQAQQQRKKTVAQLQAMISGQQAALSELKQSQTALTEAIERIKELALSPITLEGLKPLRGRLNLPTRGRVRNYFGKRRHGRLAWKGIIIEGQEGTSINTIHHGQVLFADWLKGFGWVIVIDHGNGYMSLYGHNQTLLKAVGEKVEAGEPIALLGQSGGQDIASLYFEIRYQGKAINPMRWFKKG